MRTRLTTITSAAACLALLCAAPFGVQAATHLVSSTADSGTGSLREALAGAADGDTIDATGVAGTITLTSGQLLAPCGLTILGPGSATLTVSGNAAFPVLELAGADVTIYGLTIADGSSALSGAGIRISSGPASTIRIRECVVAGNSTTQNGGGIYSGAGVSLEISNSIISGNSASGSGGGIYNDHGTVTVVASTVSANTAATGGGGILNDGASTWGILQIHRSTLSGNWASFGGGIYTTGVSGGCGTLIIESSTFSGNAAGSAGAIYNDGAWGGAAQVEINACTFSGVGGDDQRRLIRNDGRFGGDADVDLGDTILSGGVSGTNIDNDAGQVRSFGYNLCSDNGGGLLTEATDLVNTDPLLGPLQDNGGPTFTHVPQPGSPAIDAGSRSAFGYTVSPEQRGLPEVSDDPAIANASGGDGSDIGAVEVVPPATIVKQAMKLNFAKPDSDCFSLTALLDLGSGFAPSGQVVSLDVGGAAVALALDAKGRGATGRDEVPAGKIKLALNRKTGLWALSATFKRGCWQDPWSALGLVDGDVPRPGQEVTVLTVVQIGSGYFAGWRSLVYTAKVGKSGTAK